MASAKRQIAMGAGLRLTLRMVNMIIAIVLTPYILHSLGDAVYGIWTLVGSFMAFYGLLDMGISMATNRYITVAISAEEQGGEGEAVQRVFSSSLALFWAAAGAVMLCTVIGMWPAALLVDEPAHVDKLRYVMLVMGMTLALSCPLKVYAGILESKLRLDLMGIPPIVGAFLRAGAVVVALETGWGVVGVAVATAFGVLPVGLAHLVMAHRVVPGLKFRWGHVRGGTLKELLGYGRKSVMLGVGNKMRTDFDAIVIASFLTTVVVAHYRIAAFFAQQLCYVAVATIGALQPYFSRLVGQQNDARQTEVLLTSTRLSVYLVSFMSVAMIVMGEPFIVRWVGPEYTVAYPVMVVLLVGYLLELSHLPASPYLCARASHGMIAWRSVIDSSVNILLSIVLVRHYGMMGVALGTSIPLTVSAVVVYPWMVHRASGIAYSRYYGELLKAYLISGVALAGPVVIGLRYAEPSYLNLVTLGVVWVVLFVPVVCLLEGRGRLVRRWQRSRTAAAITEP